MIFQIAPVNPKIAPINWLMGAFFFSKLAPVKKKKYFDPWMVAIKLILTNWKEVAPLLGVSSAKKLTLQSTARNGRVLTNLGKFDFTTRRFSNHESRLLSWSHTCAIIVLLDLTPYLLSLVWTMEFFMFTIFEISWFLSARGSVLQLQAKIEIFS